METPENQGSAAIDTSGTKQSANKQSDSTSAEQQGSACGRATACAGMDVASIANRVKGMIFDPRNTWQQVKSEQQQIREIYTGFLIPLAAVATIATIIKSSVLGTSIPFVGMSVKLSFMSALTTGVISFAFQMISIYLLAAIIPLSLIHI